MDDFERVLNACLDDLAAGRLDVEECLRRYPAHAGRLRPLLLAASAVQQAYDAQPREEFTQAARERFHFATGAHLRRAFDVDPSPSFFAAARIKFLMTAQRMGLRERARPPRRLPLFGTPFRALATGMAAFAVFLGGSTYTVASAQSALPGDWQYGVKLQTERVRLALAFSEDARRDVRLDIATERAEEIEQLAQKGRPIGEAELKRLQNETAPLIDDANKDKLDTGAIEKLVAVTAKQKQVLAAVEDRVDPKAAPVLAEVKDLSERGYEVAFVKLTARQEGPLVVTPSDPIETQTPDPTDTPEPTATATPGDTSTPGAESPTPFPTEPPLTTTPGLSVGDEPEGSLHGVTWVRLAAGRITTLIPSEADGWRIMGVQTTDGSSPAPALVRLVNFNATALITLNTLNGDMYWFVLRNGVFDEVQMRITRDGQTFVIDRDAIRSVYGAAAEIPIYVLDHIEFPPPPLTPTSTDTPPAE